MKEARDIAFVNRQNFFEHFHVGISGGQLSPRLLELSLLAPWHYTSVKIFLEHQQIDILSCTVLK